MKNKILILGKGFIGQRLYDFFKCDISEAKIYSFEDAEGEIKKHNPKIIINCIGYAGEKNIDDCEKDKDKALLSNTFIPTILSEIIIRNNIKLIHISSGCIYHFDYQRQEPIKEEEEPYFFELFYSRTKIYSEDILKHLSDKFNILIVRIRIPLDSRPHPKNILTKLINYKKVIDIPNSVTYIPDFIHALRHLIEIDAKGIYNVVNRGALRYPELLDIYRKYKPSFKYEMVDFKKLGLVRTNLVLSIEKLRKSGFKIRDIHEALEECVKEYIKY